MELTFFTNIPSPHQLPLGKALAKQLPGNFSLVCWEPIDDERKKLGWTDNSNPEWLIRAWKSKSAYKNAIDLIHSSEVVVWGYAPLSIINKRVEAGKLTFLYTERPFKRGRWRIFDPRVAKGIHNIIKFGNKENYHLLSVGPYCADDYKFLRVFKNRMWRWGYFIEIPNFEIHKKHNEIPTILWAGRMLALKRVNLLLQAAAWARTKGCNSFRLRIIGSGPEENRLKALAAHLGLLDVCKFDKPMSPAEIGLAMDDSDIYVFPSDKNEGWGVVANEAMSSACCVIGGKEIGSVPWLIKDGVNGCVFIRGVVEDLGQKLRWCIDHPEQRLEMGIAARNTIERQWSPEVAAERFLALCEAIESGKPSPYQDGGPCSPV